MDTLDEVTRVGPLFDRLAMNFQQEMVAVTLNLKTELLELMQHVGSCVNNVIAFVLIVPR